MHCSFLYGTAWKEEKTSDCVYKALKAGFRGIDTANQRKHYFEQGVGEGLKQAYKELGLSRDNLFLQTKFTYERGQDHRLPYNPNDSFSEQVRSSFESSLNHLNTDYIDSLVLHGPFSDKGITSEDKEVWQEMQKLYREEKVKYLGLSNVSTAQLKAFYQWAEIKPKFAQIRCFAINGWEKESRDFCKEQDIIFQGFSLLTANRDYLNATIQRVNGQAIPKLRFNKNDNNLNPIFEIIKEHNKSIAQIIFKFCLQVGILPLTGTTNYEHMKLDLQLNDFELSESQIKTIETIAFL
jgi:diketogulonate reductase-like aldo/keto reductase